jgi:hypothetical protein
MNDEGRMTKLLILLGVLGVLAVNSSAVENARLRPIIETDAGGPPVVLSQADGAKTVATVPSEARGKRLHVILCVTDGGVPALTRYRRIVLDVADGAR